MLLSSRPLDAYAAKDRLLHTVRVQLGSLNAPAVQLAAGDMRSQLDGLDPAASLVLDAMPARAAASTESIVRSAGLSPKETTSALGILELSGKVERTASGWRRRTRKSAGGRE